jgi:hypothetical protein
MAIRSIILLAMTTIKPLVQANRSLQTKTAEQEKDELRQQELMLRDSVRSFRAADRLSRDELYESRRSV